VGSVVARSVEALSRSSCLPVPLALVRAPRFARARSCSPPVVPSCSPLWLAHGLGACGCASARARRCSTAALARSRTRAMPPRLPHFGEPPPTRSGSPAPTHAASLGHRARGNGDRRCTPRPTCAVPGRLASLSEEVPLRGRRRGGIARWRERGRWMSTRTLAFSRSERSCRHRALTRGADRSGRTLTAANRRMLRVR
jgi:hypothetical protein